MDVCGCPPDFSKVLICGSQALDVLDEEIVTGASHDGISMASDIYRPWTVLTLHQGSTPLKNEASL